MKYEVLDTGNLYSTAYVYMDIADIVIFANMIPLSE